MTTTNAILGLTIGGMLMEAIAFAIAMWVLYYVVKTAVRDGINESAAARRPAPPQHFSRTRPTDLPDMRAD